MLLSISCLCTSLLASDASADQGSEDEQDLVYLVPELEGAGTSLSEGRRSFTRRFSLGLAYGEIGSHPLFALRLAYNPNSWLGYEASLGHNPASSIHAFFHSLNVIGRYPLAGRFQPYAIVGFGMVSVYPGKAMNADPVSKNALSYGGGVEAYLRDDAAVRAELKGVSVIGREVDGTGSAAYSYREFTIGFTFYRNLGD